MTDSLHKAIAASVAKTGAQDLGYFTADYGLAVGYEIPDDEKDGRLRYLIVNRVTGVVEGVGPVLGMAIASMYNCQTVLDSVRKEYLERTQAAKPAGNLNS